MEQGRTRQLTWTQSFERELKQSDVRRKLIRGLPIDEQAKELLLKLDAIFRDAVAVNGPGAEVLDDGTASIRVRTEDVLKAMKLGSKNTLAKIRQRLGATPYFGWIDGKKSAHTYHVRWPAIVEDSRDESGRHIVGEHLRRADRIGGLSHGHSDGQSDGHIDRHSDRHIDGQSDRQNDRRHKGGLGGLEGVLRSGSKENKNPPTLPPSKVRIDRQSDRQPRPANEPQRLPPWLWRQWVDAVDAADLTMPLDVEELYGLAVSLGCFPASEENRRHVFGQAAKATRPGNGWRFPKRIFAMNVMRGGEYLTHYADILDGDRARQMLAAADRGEAVVQARDQELGRMQARHDAALDELRERNEAALRRQGFLRDIAAFQKRQSERMNAPTTR